MIGYLLAVLLGASVLYLWTLRPQTDVSLDDVDRQIDQDLEDIEAEQRGELAEYHKEFQGFAREVAKEISELTLDEQAEESKDMLGLSEDA